MENIGFEEIVRTIIIVMTLGTSAITFLFKNSKNKKFRNYAEKWNDVQFKLIDLIETAEKLINFRGADKREWVLTKVHQFCINNGITYEHKKAEALLERFVAHTKNVNKRPKDEVMTNQPQVDEFGRLVNEHNTV